MATENYRTGVTWAERIAKDSLYIEYYMKPSKNGRKSIVSGEILDHSKDNLIGLTQVDSSLFILLPTYYPEIYTDVDNGDILKTTFKGVWNLLCQTVTEVSGFNDINLEVLLPTYKTAFFSNPLYTVLQNPTNEITLTIPTEYSGYLFTNMFRHWLNAISDEHTKIATYNGLKEHFNNWSHSAGMAYIKPNKTFTKVDYGALFFLMVPKSAPLSNFNANGTSQQVTTMQIAFNVSVIDNRNLLVARLLDDLLVKYKAFVVEDSTLFGLVKGTSFDTVEEMYNRGIFENLASDLVR